MTIQSNVDLSLLNGLLPFGCVFDVSFQFLILHLLLSVCTQFYHLLLVFLLVDFPQVCVKYLTYFSFSIHFVKISNPIQPTYSDQ